MELEGRLVELHGPRGEEDDAHEAFETAALAREESLIGSVGTWEQE